MQEKGKDLFVSALKIAMISLFIASLLILIFALLLTFLNFSQGTVKIVNQFIKVISIAVASMIVIRESDGAIKGGIGGVLFTLFIHLVFALFSEGQFDSIFWLDLVFCMSVGIIAGIVAVNVKK